jgi:outer membrane lipoprotein SlyB
MKIHSRTILLTAIPALFASGCTTEIGPNGQQRSVMTPMGAAALQTVTAAGIGAGTGALMPHMNSVAAGAISAGAGSVGSQAINAFIPKASSQSSAQQSANSPLYVRTSDGSFVPAKIRYVQQADGSYVPSYPTNRNLYRQLPNGSFAPAN